MGNKEVNLLLLKAIPEIKDSFEKETSWQEGLDTGSHLVFGYVLVPFTIAALENNQDDILKRIFKLINDMLTSGDDYQEEVAQVSFLESLKADYAEIYDFSKIMLPETYSIFAKLEF